MQVWKFIKQLFARPEPLKLNLQQPVALSDFRKPNLRQPANWHDDPAWHINPPQQMHYFQVPELKQEDVERIVRRDYPPNLFDSVMNLLEGYADKRGSEALRTRLAILKLANGDYRRINVYLDMANYDYRDVLSKVQYPIPHEWLYRETQ